MMMSLKVSSELFTGPLWTTSTFWYPVHACWEVSLNTTATRSSITVNTEKFSEWLCLEALSYLYWGEKVSGVSMFLANISEGLAQTDCWQHSSVTVITAAKMSTAPTLTNPYGCLDSVCNVMFACMGVKCTCELNTCSLCCMSSIGQGHSVNKREGSYWSAVFTWLSNQFAWPELVCVKILLWNGLIGQFSRKKWKSWLKVVSPP